MPALAAWCILVIPSSVIKLLTPMLVWCPQTKRRPALLHHPRVLRTMKSVWACNHVQIGHLIFFFSLPLLYMQIENHIWTPFFPILSSSFSLYFPAILSFNEKQCTYCSEWFSLHSFSLSPLLFLIAFLFSIPYICHFSLYETKIILKKEKNTSVDPGDLYAFFFFLRCGILEILHVLEFQALVSPACPSR